MLKPLNVSVRVTIGRLLKCTVGEGRSQGSQCLKLKFTQQFLKPGAPLKCLTPFPGVFCLKKTHL